MSKTAQKNVVDSSGELFLRETRKCPRRPRKDSETVNTCVLYILYKCLRKYKPIFFKLVFSELLVIPVSTVIQYTKELFNDET